MIAGSEIDSITPNRRTPNKTFHDQLAQLYIVKLRVFKLINMITMMKLLII
jgi:hypothetical protein